MTNQEKVILSAYSGVLLCDNFDDVHHYVEQKLGRPIFTHEVCDKSILDQVKDLALKDLIDICCGPSCNT